MQSTEIPTWICEGARRLCPCIICDTLNGREDAKDSISTHETNGEKQADIEAATW